MGSFCTGRECAVEARAAGSRVGRLAGSLSGGTGTLPASPPLKPFPSQTSLWKTGRLPFGVNVTTCVHSSVVVRTGEWREK